MRKILLSMFFSCSVTAYEADSKPANVVLIFVDDLGYCASGLYGCEAPTPNIQKLVAEGALFSNGYVTSPVCSPSRAGLLTGRSQQRFGHHYLPEGEPNGNGGLPVGETTLAEAMKKVGYATGMVGKWHLGTNWEFHPINRGFDEFFGLLGAATDYVDHSREDVVVEKRWGMKLPLLSYSIKDLTFWALIKALWSESGAPVLLRGTNKVREDRYLTEAFSQEAVNFINNHKQEPFFLYLPYTAVHSPYQVTRKYYDRFLHIEDERTRIQMAMVAALDDGIGSVMGALKANHLEENTLVFFISDNGAGADTDSNAPLRMGKHSLFEGGNRIPFAIKWPVKVPKGIIFQAPVSTLDVFPTALAAAGAEFPKGQKLEGVNLVPFLNENKNAAPHESLFWRQGRNWAIRSDNWKLIYAADRYWLYDLSRDIGEKHNLAGNHPEKIEQLTEKYKEWDNQNGGPAWPSYSSKAMPELSVDEVSIEWIF